MQKEYFVVPRSDHEWWIYEGGVSTGPCASNDVATSTAIDLAKADRGNHIYAKVYLEENLLSGMTLIYDSTTATDTPHE